mmetsp:Transcript_74210/g.176782  ORF Transcript_74210/g.176782 Transcript_74210/m.176782 type:complete len:243 (-) Transcript_74210:1658-2386(-)
MARRVSCLASNSAMTSGADSSPGTGGNGMASKCARRRVFAILLGSARTTSTMVWYATDHSGLRSSGSSCAERTALGISTIIFIFVLPASELGSGATCFSSASAPAAVGTDLTLASMASVATETGSTLRGTGCRPRQIAAAPVALALELAQLPALVETGADVTRCACAAAVLLNFLGTEATRSAVARSPRLAKVRYALGVQNRLRSAFRSSKRRSCRKGRSRSGIFGGSRVTVSMMSFTSSST